MTKIRERENSLRREVLGNEPDQHRRRHLAPLDDAQVDEPWHDSGDVSRPTPARSARVVRVSSCVVRASVPRIRP